jgi:hypothetical protein
LLKRFRKKTRIDELLDATYKKLATVEEGSEEHEKLLRTAERLTKLKEENPRKPVSWDTIVTTLGQLAVVLIVVIYEDKRVWTSKIPIPKFGSKG